MKLGNKKYCECVTLLQSFHRGTLSIHRYIAFNIKTINSDANPPL